MATTLMPLDPATTPQRAQRLLTIAANLLPAEVIAARRAKAVRTRVLAVLAAVVLLLGGWYGFAAYQAKLAQDDLDAALAEQATLSAQQTRYEEVVRMQADSTAISTRLSTLFAEDVRWATLLSTLRGDAAAVKVRITSVNGNVTPADAAGAAKLPSDADGKVIGTLTITGTGRDKRSVAAYLDRLGEADSLANLYLTSTTLNDKSEQFSLTADITGGALGGRYNTGTKGTK
jgi:Tfp pilus assembly protein PilN